MSSLLDLVSSSWHWLIDLLRDPGPFIRLAGYPGMALIIFIETGLLFPLLPGDSLLVVAGIYAAAGQFDLHWLILLLVPCAILGDATSYYIGRRVGPKLFTRPESRFFRPAYVEQARAFYERHGGKAIIVARFVPIIRTFVPVIAGVAQMPYRRFALYNIAGGIGWIVSMTTVGYFLGDLCARAGFPLQKHLEKVIILAVFLSILPALVAWRRERRRTQAAHKAA